ncbi:Lactoylglutathione lyase [Prototheca wickerhamii]|uniref:lactoylglutathione lyase n=1 Tax=Prototheca wickerhamii TaxID=3111 RepID=A0AAD9INX8_PROWI|nr:Lactoylglutathione lyase [Prototheca wickerhamii]
MSSTAPTGFAAEDSRRILHAVFRVGNLDKTVQLYKDAFGMQLLRERDVPEEKYKNVFLGFGPEDKHTALELTYNYDREEYDLGEGFGHFAVASTDIYKLAERIKEKGGQISREPGPVKGGSTHIAFARDPTGYQWELIQREKPSAEPLAQVMLRVGDLDKSIDFYTRVLGMKLIRRRDNEQYKYTLAFLGFKGEETEETVFELTYNWGRDSYKKGDGYAQAAIGTDDVHRSADEIKAAGWELAKEPTELPGIGTKIFALHDPDGYKIVFVDNKDFLKELEG